MPDHDAPQRRDHTLPTPCPGGGQGHASVELRHAGQVPHSNGPDGNRATSRQAILARERRNLAAGILGATPRAVEPPRRPGRVATCRVSPSSIRFPVQVAT
jgi:hypothetical protein